MPDFPRFNAAGDLPVGIHGASLGEIRRRFGEQSPTRRTIAERLDRIYSLAIQTGHLARFIIFGSFVTAENAPHDVDVFLLMDDSFDAQQLRGETAILFNNPWAQGYFGASVFWLRRLAALGGEQSEVEDWQIKRDGTRRGIVEVIPDDSQ